MRKFPLIVACGLGFAVAAMAFAPAADARRGGGGGVRASGHAVGHARPTQVYRGNPQVMRNVNPRYVYRGGRRGYWRNGVWVAAPVAAGATYMYGSSCSYAYSNWQATGSNYWRDQYYLCAQ